MKFQRDGENTYCKLRRPGQPSSCEETAIPSLGESYLFCCLLVNIYGPEKKCESPQENNKFCDFIHV